VVELLDGDTRIILSFLRASCKCQKKEDKAYIVGTPKQKKIGLNAPWVGGPPNQWAREVS